jgi:MinD-like ATPase involved in chromosome partitioning or flagellar assembly
LFSDATYDEIVHDTSHERLLLVPYGAAPHPLPAKPSSRAHGLADELAARFDVVVLRSPTDERHPLLDTVGSLVPAEVVVTREELGALGRVQLRPGLRLLGIVENGVL